MWSTTDIIAVLALIVSIATAIYAWQQVKAAQRANELAVTNNSATLILQLSDEFDGRMLPQRAGAAQALQNAWPDGGGRVVPLGANSSLFDPIANFFDTVGLWVRLQVLTPEMAWSLFWSPAIYYWKIAEEKCHYVSQVQEGGKGYWEDYKCLVHILRTEDKKHSQENTREPDDIELRAFLIGEIALKETASTNVARYGARQDYLRMQPSSKPQQTPQRTLLGLSFNRRRD